MDERMDINGIHEIMQTPSKFHVPDFNHKAHIQDTVHENNERTYTEKQSLNEMDLYDNDNLMHENDSLMNEIFNNPEEEIIFNYDEIDEDELTDEGDVNTVDQETFQHNTQTSEEEKHNTNEKHIKEINNGLSPINKKEQSGRTRQPNTKYQDFYQFI